ncbi:E3 ubiquitin-protein ligase XB3 [Hordeum vulgare]|nr:E3 ubiquitin-protein ligase XB3 [Hordeum vulgare]
MEGNESDFDQSGSVDWGVIPCALEEAIAVCIALHRSQDNARSTTGFVLHDSIASAQRTLGSSGDGSSRFRGSESLSFPITAPIDYESNWERAARRGKERIRVVKARIAEEMAATEAAVGEAQAAEEEEAIHTCVFEETTVEEQVHPRPRA